MSNTPDPKNLLLVPNATEEAADDKSKRETRENFSYNISCYSSMNDQVSESIPDKRMHQGKI